MTLPFIRFFNLLKITAIYLLSLVLKRPVHWGMPVAAGFEPCNTCNLHCPECPAGRRELTREKGFMDSGLFSRSMDELLPELSRIMLYFQGEPFLNRHFFDFIRKARAGRIHVTTSTNGHFLDETTVREIVTSGLNRVIISLDGPDQERYEVYRKGGDFARVTRGIRLLVAEKRRLRSHMPVIILQCLVLRSNENLLDEMRQLARDLGVYRLEFKSAQFYDFEQGNELMPEDRRFSRYERIESADKDPQSEDRNSKSEVKNGGGRQYKIRNPLRNACFRMWSSCEITWDGKVVPCCFDKDAEHVMGDLTKQSFREIWRSERYRQFRKQILTNRKGVEMCRNCSQVF